MKIKPYKCETDGCKNLVTTINQEVPASYCPPCRKKRQQTFGISRKNGG